MTANEMRYEFVFGLNSISNNTAPDFEDSEIGLLLSKAQERFVLQYYSGHNKIKQSLELTEKGRKDLSELIRSQSINTPSPSQSGTFPNGVFYDLPADFLFAIQEQLIAVSDDDCVNGKRINIKPMTHDRYNENIINPFKNPDESLAWRLDFSEGTNSEKRHELIHGDTYSIGSYELRYIKFPSSIVCDLDVPANQVDSELNEITHRRIVDMAIELAMEYTQDGRLQTQMLINQMNE